MHSCIISPEIVHENLEKTNWRFFDCRFLLTKPDQKKTEFEISHIPRSSYINLEHDLSDLPIQGKTGRHPLPQIKDLVEKFSRWGIDSSIQVVIYDDCGGAHAARFWWMLRWLGHDAVSVLDGGWQRWINERRPISSEKFYSEYRKFNPKTRHHLCVNVENILDSFDKERFFLIDARSYERFTGKNENVDRIGGHIPGAISNPFSMNLREDGSWKSKSELHKMYSKILGIHSVEETISYCGSGITACHNILAMCHAGLGFARLYPGSWSDWINDPQRPISITKS